MTRWAGTLEDEAGGPITNRITRPSFETGDTGKWGRICGSAVTACPAPSRTADGYQSRWGLSMTGTTGPGPGTTGLVLLSGSYGNNGSIPVTAGDRVVMSYRGKVTGDGCTRLRVSAYRWDAAGTATAVTQNFAAVENPENDTWYRVIGSLTVPADGTASIGMRTGCSEMPFDSTTTFTVDEAKIVVNPPVSNPTPGYLDGDTPGASWAGASDASTSNGVPFSGTW